MRSYDVEIKFKTEITGDEELLLNVYVSGTNRDGARKAAHLKFAELSKVFKYPPYDIKATVWGDGEVK